MEPIGTGRRSLADEAYQRITDAMLTGSLAPGSRLVMDTLAEHLQISRTPVRDALKRLEQEGLVSSAGRRGFMVRDLDAKEIRETYEARAAIEGYAVRLAAANGTEAAGLVRAAIDRAVEHDLDTVMGSYLANREVHRAVVEAAGNAILLELFDGLWSRGRAHQIYADCFRTDDSAAAVRRKHAPIVKALKANDPVAAERAMAAHLYDGLRSHHLSD
ncbi:MAG: GntR family transcriptional regulator [Acidimicrobiia bacterium]